MSPTPPAATWAFLIGTCLHATSATTLSIPLYQRASSQPSVTGEAFDAGFWYGSFDVGLSRNLSLLIDTASADVILNRDLYKPGPDSRKVDQDIPIYYSTARADGCGFLEMNTTTYSDTLQFGGRVSTNQTIGVVTNGIPEHPQEGTEYSWPHDGVAGFLGTGANATASQGVPFFQQLCDQGAVGECRFGLAFGTNGTGEQVIGGVDEALFEGDLFAQSLNEPEWILKASVDVPTLEGEQYVLLDSGTSNIVGNRTWVRALFNSLGMESYEQDLPACRRALFGYYPCDKPPSVGFNIGDRAGGNFKIAPSAFRLRDDGGNNCTATITGLDIGAGAWILGQSFFQGKYVDFDKEGKKIGFAVLK